MNGLQIVTLTPATVAGDHVVDLVRPVLAAKPAHIGRTKNFPANRRPPRRHTRRARRPHQRSLSSKERITETTNQYINTERDKTPTHCKVFIPFPFTVKKYWSLSFFYPDRPEGGQGFLSLTTPALQRPALNQPFKGEPPGGGS
jgi:hypothetical protein